MDLTSAIPTGKEYLTAREARWVQRRCARHGHVLAHLADPEISALTGPITLGASGGSLLRCLRCGAWVDPEAAGIAEVVGSAQAPSGLDSLPLPVRGGHGRRFGLLKVVAVERFVKGLALISGSLVVYHVASSRGSLLAELERLLLAFRPLGNELGVHLTGSPLISRIEGWLGGSGDPVRLAGFGLLAYGILQLVEGVGLWGGWRWAEYLAVVATSVFIPFELYEIAEKPSPLKVVFLVLNVLIVIYLVYKGRLFGLRGGHEAYLREVRDSTLPADLLRSIGRSPTELSSPRIV